MKDRNANMPTTITLAEGDASVTFIHFWWDLKWKFSNVNKKTSLQDQDDLACCPPHPSPPVSDVDAHFAFFTVLIAHLQLLLPFLQLLLPF